MKTSDTDEHEQEKKKMKTLNQEPVIKDFFTTITTNATVWPLEGNISK